MAFSSRLTSDLVKIAAAGGGFRLDAAPRLTSDLVKIAAAAKSGGASVTFVGMAPRLTSDLVKIGAAGGGAVCFED